MGRPLRGLDAGLVRRQGTEQTAGLHKDKGGAGAARGGRVDEAGAEEAPVPRGLPRGAAAGGRQQGAPGRALAHRAVAGGSQVSEGNLRVGSFEIDVGLVAVIWCTLWRLDEAKTCRQSQLHEIRKPTYSKWPIETIFTLFLMDEYKTKVKSKFIKHKTKSHTLQNPLTKN